MPLIIHFILESLIISGIGMESTVDGTPKAATRERILYNLDNWKLKNCRKH
jgi:hypothetical protein